MTNGQRSLAGRRSRAEPWTSQQTLAVCESSQLLVLLLHIHRQGGDGYEEVAPRAATIRTRPAFAGWSRVPRGTGGQPANAGRLSWRGDGCVQVQRISNKLESGTATM